MLVYSSEDPQVGIRYTSGENNTRLVGMDQCFSSMDSLTFFPSDATYDTVTISVKTQLRIEYMVHYIPCLSSRVQPRSRDLC
jgi:hypothetical protein